MKASNRKIMLYIGGMTCINCQNKIEKTLNKTYGVCSARVSYRDGRAEIVYDEKKISVREIRETIESLDYEVLDRPQKQVPDIIRTIYLLAVILMLYVILQSQNLLNRLVPSQLADSKMGYGMLFIIGLITSVHCIAMCGGINLSQCIPQSEQGEEGGGKLSAFRAAFLYNLGRVISYTAIGFVLGLLGMIIGGDAQIGMGEILQGIVKIIAGVFMIIMGINLLGLFPGLRKFTIRMPRTLAVRVGVERAKSNRPFYVGILNGFMPCGPLQAMWIVALGTTNPLAGALSMFLFSLGTVPLMLGLGSIVSALGKKFTKKMMTAGAVLVVVLGLAMVSQGCSLSGLSPVWGRQKKAEAGEAGDVSIQNTDGIQEVHSTLEIGRYPNITVQKGIPVKWIIDAPEGSINGCNYRMRIPNLNLEHTFQAGENVIEFTPEEIGTIQYSCWMGMIHGSIYVTDDGTEAEDVTESNAVEQEAAEAVPSGYSIPTENIAVASMGEDEQGNPIQKVDVRLTDQGFEPAIVVVQKEINVIWNITVEREDADGGIDFLAPMYSTKLTLESGENPLSLYPTEDFDVAVGDYKGFAYLKVVDDLNYIDETAIRAEVADYEPQIYPASIYDTGMSCCN
ncbi:MAG: sulfite exporter TauE/SafE family protein [Eubacteriales bacterium]|nr:sulfite exporter TauE/SafE family protein [Eubacteriales bacterium]